MKLKNTIYPLFAYFLIFVSCQHNPLDVDLEKKNIDIQQFDLDSVYLKSSLLEAKVAHAEMVKILGPIYLYDIGLNVKQNIDSLFHLGIKQFYQNEYILSLENEKKNLKPELDVELNKLSSAFAYLKHHFESIKIPKKIVFINQMFGETQVDDSIISVGLEKYLPPDSPTIKQIPSDQLHDWQKKQMDISFLARDLVLKWIQVHLFKEMNENLAQHLVQAGKILYVLNASFPKASDAFILRYNSDQYRWAKSNEAMFWDFLVKEEMLFKDNMRDKANFLNEGPYTIGLPEESPDRMGQYIGFIMVKQYMQNNKNLSLPALLKINFNKILQAYKIGK